MIAGAKIDLMDNELESVKAYLKRGGNLFVLLDPFKTPKLATFLKDYGFETGDGIIVDTMSRVFGGDYLIPVISTYIKFAITKDFTLASFFPECRSVKASTNPGANIVAQDLALTSPASWTINEEQLNRNDANFDEKTGVKGPLSVMAVSTVTMTDQTKQNPTGDKASKNESTDEGSGNETPKKSRIVVTGSSMFAANKIFQALQANRELFMNTISWLAEDENLIAIRPKSSKAQPLILTSNEPLVILLVPVVLIPLAWILADLSSSCTAGGR